MNYCKKCGNEIQENVKFCTNCGENNNSSNIDSISNDKGSEYENHKNNINVNSSVKYDKSKKNNLKIIIPLIIFVLLAAIAGGVFMKINESQKENMKKSIEILNMDIDNYPNVVVSIKAINYEENLTVKNFTVKENDAFQKDLKLSEVLEGNEYKISYKTSDEYTSGDIKIKVACLAADNEEIAEYSYKSPEKARTNTQAVNSNNVVDTYDSNEIEVKQVLDSYENSYIRMINSRNINYIKDSIDLSGSLISEFTNLIKSYSEQKISEDLMNYKIEDIRKINDSQYEITVYEKYYILYGKENKSTYTDFRTNYIVNKTNLGFKIYSIKNTVKLGSTTNP